MIFIKKIIDNYTIQRYSVSGIGRHYYITLEDGGKHIFPSMTTILSDEEPVFLKEWRKRVGTVQAERICRISTDAGTELHQFCEYIMLRDAENASKVFANSKDRRAKFFMKKILPYLKQYKTILASEEFLFSLKYRIAGTLDACVIVDGIIYILDFKTSKSAKAPEKIENYYIQIAGYAIMWEEITGQVVDFGKILLVNPYSVQQFDVSLLEYKEKFIEVVNNFYTKYGNEYQQFLLEDIDNSK